MEKDLEGGEKQMVFKEKGRINGKEEFVTAERLFKMEVTSYHFWTQSSSL